jgi:hypothetical protein
MAEDWLPHEPPAPEPAPTSVRKTVVIWLILIVMFIAIFMLMNANDPSPVERSGYSGWWIGVGIAATVGVVILLLVWVAGGTKQFNERAAPGLAAIAEGNFTQAAQLFEQLAKRYRAKPNFAAVAHYNRGYALMLSGDTAAAVGVLLGVERTPKLAAGGVRRLAATQIARCFALAGDVDKAQHWLDATRRRGAGMTDPIHDQAVLAALEGLVLCRQGKLDEARAHYESVWPRLCAYLAVNQMAEVWLLRAFAIAAGGTPRDAGGAEPWLRLVRSAPAGVIDRITVRWPALATFAVTNELGTRRAA